MSSVAAEPELKLPAWHTAPERAHTFGPEVSAICDQIGFSPDPEQRLILDDLFAVTEDGMSAAFETCIVAPRQAMKTGAMKQAVIGWLFVTQEEVVTWSAHEFFTAKQALGDLAAMFTGSPMLRKRLANDSVDGVHGGNFDPHILLRNGSRLQFRARTNKGGRGLTGDKIILDEALELQPEHIGALTPTLTVVPDPQLLYGSSAGMAHSTILRDIRDRGRTGSDSLAYAEWCATRQPCGAEDCQHWKPSDPRHDPRCALDDEDLWREAYPLLDRPQRSNGTGLTIGRLRKFREALAPDQFQREYLGWWDEPGAADVFGPYKWEACTAEEPDSGLSVEALGVAVSFNLRHAAVVAAGADGDVVHVKPIHHEQGTDWVAQSAVELQQEYGAPLVIDNHGPGANLIPLLESAGAEVVSTNSQQMYDACAGLYTLVQDERLRHASYPELDAAVDGAVQQTVGDRWRWGRRQSESDISPLEAATLAAWQAAKPEEQPFVSAYEDRDPIMI